MSLYSPWSWDVHVYFCSHTTLTTSPTRPTCRDVGSKLVFSKSVDACWGRPEYVRSLEHVQARITLSHNQRGKLAIHLISPLGTCSTLLFPRYTVNAPLYTQTQQQLDRGINLFHAHRQPQCAFTCVFNLCSDTPTCVLCGGGGNTVLPPENKWHNHLICAFLAGPMTSPLRDSTTGPL